MKLNNITNGIIEHEKTCSFLYRSWGLPAWICQVKNRSQYLIHTLYIQYFWIELSVNKKNPRHVIIPITFSLLFFVRNKFFVFLLILPIYQPEFLPSGTCKERNHYVRCWRTEKRKLCMCAWSVFLDLLP